jgi:hypothetical protein
MSRIIGWSAAVTGLAAAARLAAEQVAISEIMYNPPGAGAPEFIEVQNLTSNRIDMARWTLSGGATLTLPGFDPASPSRHFLNEYERIILSSADPTSTRLAYPGIGSGTRIFGPWDGLLSNAGDTVVLKDASGALQAQVTYGDDDEWPVSADGAGHSLVLNNSNRDNDDSRNWKASPRRLGSPGSSDPVRPEEPLAVTEPSLASAYVVTDFNSTPATGGVPAPARPTDTKWKFYAGTTAPPVEWRTTTFNDAAWEPSDPALGYAPLGFEPATPSATFPGIRTPVPANQPLATYYFRTTFQWNGPLTGTTANFDQFLDDGALVWLNGQSLVRERLAAGTPTHATLANAESPDGTEEFDRMPVTATLLNGKLVNGTNTLAIEVHNRATTNDDMVMALRMKLVTTIPGVLINEIRPAAVAGQGFVEFHNPLATAVDLQGHYLSSDPSDLKRHQIAGSLVVPAGGLATIDFASSGLQVGSPVQIYLTRPDGVSKMAAASARVPLDGRSAGRKPAGGAAWYVFTTPTPGTPNQSSALPATSPLRLSEVHHDGSGQVTWIEVANPSSSSASAAGLFLSDSRDLTTRVALSGTVASGGQASVAVNYAVPSDGDLFLYLADADLNVLDAVKLEPGNAGFPSIQRFPISGNDWYHAATATRDAPNAPDVRTSIVINEIMFRPPSSHSAGEFVEIVNRGAAPVALTGWRFAEGIDYTFPAGAMLAAGSHAVVARDPGYMTTHYPGITQVFGPFDGTLRNRGERLRLEDERGNLADEVHYESGGQWPQTPGGEGSSLELIHPDMDNSQPSAWRASDETQKSTLQTYTHTGIYRELRGIPNGATTARELHLHCVSDSHLLLRGITLTRAGSGNLITTGDATSHNGTSAAGFLCTGTHSQSDTLPRTGATITGDPGFHIISTGTGDTKNNKTEVDCTTIARNDILTLTFQARWISGMPLLVAQTWDRSFGTVFRLPIPNNLGTPGAANSARRPAPAPTVDQLGHFPVVPSSTQPVVVTARVQSSATPPTVELVRRLDNANADAAWTRQPMNDAGTAGDATAGDGVYSATVPAQADTTITQFYVEATAPGGEINQSPRNGATRPAMWIVDNAPPTGRPGTVVHRFILSQYHRAALGTAGWSSKYDWDFPRMSNFEFNSTAIIGETTFAGGPEVLYNCGMRKGGSPWTRSADSTLDRMRWKSPGDVRYRNRVKSGVDNDATGQSRFHNRITRYWLYLFGYAVPDHEFIQQVVNESAPRLGDDMEPTDSDFFDRAYSEDPEGELFEIDDAWFMYDQAPTATGNEERIDAASVTGRWALADWTAPATPTTPSADSPIFFHGNWPLRFPEDRYDYSSLAAFIKTTVTGTPASNSWRDQMSRQLDIERAAAYTAVRGFIGEWDNFTLDRGKNGYFYRRSRDGKFEFHHWDSDLAFESGRTGMAFTGSAAGAGWTNLTGRPWFRQRIHSYLTELLEKYAKDSPRMNAWLSAMNYQATLSDTLAPFKTSVYPGPTPNTGYPGWFNARQPSAITYINGAGSNAGSPNLTRAFSITTAGGQSVSDPLFTLEGLAPSRVFAVQVEGHPEAEFDWIPDTTSYGKWRLSGIALASGLNTFTVQALDREGTLLASLPFSVSFSLNASPLASLEANPSSFNLAVNESMSLDATSSRDPEGSALSYAWSVNPPAGASLTPTTAGKATLRLTLPGLYSLSLVITDSASNSTTLQREITVYASDGFRSFGTDTVLDPGLSATNLPLRDNQPGNAWYSLEDEVGTLLVQVLDRSPLTLNSGTFPSATQDLPNTGDWILQTKTSFETRAFGHFQTGLIIDVTEAGQPVRYVFGPEGRSSFTIRRSVAGGPFTTLLGAVRLNAGGPDLAEIDGTLWSADAHFSGGSSITQNYTYGFSNTTLNDTGRSDPTGFSYAIPAANGLYDVTLRAATATAVTQSVSLNGGAAQSWSVAAGLTTVEKTLSIPQVTVGASLINTAITKTGGTGNAMLTAFEAVPVETTFTALRIRRSGGELLFAHQTIPGVWTTIATVPLPAASPAGRGGVFVATDAAQSVRIGFDYLMLADPGQGTPQAAALRLTEIMYDPSAGGVEYLEITNVSNQPLDLAGASFVEGQPFTSTAFASEILQPGEHAVLVRQDNIGAFRARYGAGPRVINLWTSGSLNNAGESVVLLDTRGNPIHDFEYGSTAPWPTAPNGLGPSLEVINVEGDYNNPLNWRASFEPLGSPGTSGLARDTDGDGQSDGQEGFFGTNPADPSSFAKITASLTGNGSVTLSWPSVAGRSYRVERTTTLKTWTAVQTVVASGNSSTFSDASGAGQRDLYYRVVALP